MTSTTTLHPPGTLSLYSVIVPARDEEGALPETLRDIYATFTAAGIPHEIVVVDDGSKDRTWAILQELRAGEIPTLVPQQNPGPHGFGRAVIYGLKHSRGDAVVIMMADASDSPKDAVKYWRLLNDEGYVGTDAGGRQRNNHKMQTERIVVEE